MSDDVDDRGEHNPAKPTSGTVLPYASRQESGNPRPWQVGVMVVIVLILIALVVLIPSVPVSHPRALTDLCRARLQSIGFALSIYQSEFHELPADLQFLLDKRYVEGVEYFRCPAHARRGLPGSGYHYVTGLRVDDPPNWIVACDDPSNHPPQINVLYRDGDVAHLNATDFETARTRFLEAFRARRGHDPVILGPDVPLVRPARPPDSPTSAPAAPHK